LSDSIESEDNHTVSKSNNCCSSLYFTLYQIIVTTYYRTTPPMEPFSPSNPVWMNGEEKILKPSSLFWLSYRSNFKPLEGYTTDGGWGCMIRTAQTLLANVLQIDAFSTTPERELLRLFADNEKATFSLHSIALVAKKYGQKIGSWLAPGTVCHIISELLDKVDVGLKCYVSVDGALYEDEMIGKLTTFNSPLLLLIPIRLGIEYLNKLYIEPIMYTYKLQQSVGVIGGRPNSSYYYVASYNQNLYYLDPHFVQKAVDMDGDFSTDTYHCVTSYKMPISEMDPSMALAFYCKNLDSLHNFIKKSKELADNSNCLYSILPSREKPNDKEMLLEINDEDY